MNSHLAMPNRARDWAVGAAVGDALREAVRGEWPLGSGRIWRTEDLAVLANQLISG